MFLNKQVAVSAFRHLVDEHVGESVTPRGTTRREQAQLLISRLEQTGFFEAPASSSHSKHLAVDGGLAAHTYHVIHAMLKLGEVIFNSKEFYFTASPLVLEKPLKESCVIVGLCHDLNKAAVFGRNYYQPNILKNNTRSEAKPYERVDRTSLGGNLESVLVASRYIDLTDDEVQAIAWCEGPYNRQFAVDVMNSCGFLTHIAHMADMMSAHIIEHHQPLRLSNKTFDDFEPRQLVIPPAPVPVEQEA